MAARTFRSDDGMFGVELAEKDVQQMLNACIQADSHETGGILAGYYIVTLDCALVTAVSTAPPDSQQGKTWFRRGENGLQYWLDRLWVSKRHYYLGEWHFHPSASASPSLVDIEQMQRIAASPHYHCPEPLLILIGGSPPVSWEINIYIFPRGKSFIMLVESKTVESL